MSTFKEILLHFWSEAARARRATSLNRAAARVCSRGLPRIFNHLAQACRPPEKAAAGARPLRFLVHLRRWHDEGLSSSISASSIKAGKSVRTAFKTAVSLAKLKGKVSPRPSRHTGATWLMQLGVHTWEAGFLATY
jgi:hypothetical protein